MTEPIPGARARTARPALHRDDGQAHHPFEDLVGQAREVGENLRDGSTQAGTGLAVVGAYVLAGELATVDGDHAAAFARYESAMRSYVKRCQKLADSVSMMVPSNRFVAGLMRLNLRMMPLMPWLRDLPANMARRAAGAITLPTYRI